jgi:hypothetical protein
VTKKNRKARRLVELFPEVSIRVLYQRDYLHLLVKYGLEPPSQLAQADEGGAAGDSKQPFANGAPLSFDLGPRPRDAAPGDTAESA